VNRDLELSVEVQGAGLFFVRSPHEGTSFPFDHYPIHSCAASIRAIEAPHARHNASDRANLLSQPLVSQRLILHHPDLETLAEALQAGVAMDLNYQ
jgi:hypothetical protein